MSSSSFLASLKAHDLNQLTLLLALLTTCSVTKAAEQLGISQPNTSKGLERLRREFNDPLLIRQGNTMKPTRLAQELLPLVENALSASSKAFAYSNEFNPFDIDGVVRIGAGDYIQSVFGSQIIQNFHFQSPKLRVQFRPVGMPTVGDLLYEDHVDITIGTFWPNLNLRHTLLFDDPYICVVASDNSAAPQSFDIENFCKQVHLDISPSGTGLLRQIIQKPLDNMKLTRHIAASISSFMAVPSVLLGSKLVALIPSRILPFYPSDSVRIVDLDFELPPYSITMWWHNITHTHQLSKWVRSELIRLITLEVQTKSKIKTKYKK
jgi:DNA-binding transcriptional LysR family regulator